MKLRNNQAVSSLLSHTLPEFGLRSCAILVLLLGNLLSYGQSVFSLHPLFTERDAIILPELEGEWYQKEFDLTMSIQKTGDNFYQLKYGEGRSTATYEAVVVKLEQHYFLDLRGLLPESIADPEFRNSFFSGHTILKLRLLEGGIEVSGLNSFWLTEAFQKHNLPIRAELTSNGLLLTSDTPQLKAFLGGSGEGSLFDEGLSFEKILSEDERSQAAPLRNGKEIIPGIQSCQPQFPLKDGWLGADGDISVALNASRSVFLFSDTYVGGKDQTTRDSPMTMISNSVAVVTCLPTGGTEVQYFWNNMYTDNVEPIFRSFTDRYHFWVLDGFAVRDELFVILEKVGPKIGATKGEIFNFSLLGYTLVKISNPYDPPGEWSMEMRSLPEFENPSFSLRSHAMNQDSVYFFIGRDEESHGLIRKHIDHIWDTEVPFEYYSHDGTWVEGIEKDKMQTVIQGFRNNTVRYHDDIDRWIMITDVRFTDNKLIMRTSRHLTGPWSSEILIFEIPEVTPAKKGYNSSNFAYLAREHAQYYDDKKKTLLITYDVNNSKFSEIVNDLAIYTPKSIRIPIRKFLKLNK